MRPLYEEFDDFDFAGSSAVSRILREQRREERRLASRRHHGPAHEDRYADSEDYDDYDDYDDQDDADVERYSALDLDE